MPDSPFGWLVLIAVGVAYLVVGVGALAFLAFCVSSLTYSVYVVVRVVWVPLRPKPRPPRGFEVVPIAAQKRSTLHRGLTLHNVCVETRNPDLRPAVVFDRVEDAAVNGLSAATNPQAKSVLRFIDARDVLVSSARVLTPASTFLQVEGKDTQSLVIDGAGLSKPAKPLAAARGASETAVTVRT